MNYLCAKFSVLIYKINYSWTNKWKDKLEIYWKDQVWSKVIAGIILAILGLFCTSVVAIFNYVYSNISFLKTLNLIYRSIVKEVTFPIWVIVIFIILFFVFTFKQFIQFCFHFINKLFHDSIINKPNELPITNNKTTVIFAERMAEAFPGVKDLVWFNNSEEATYRLSIFLKNPLVFNDSLRKSKIVPFWWFRGTSSMYYERFEKLGKTRVLLNIEEFNIKRIAVYRSSRYDRNFIYVETIAEKQTGLYNITKTEINRDIEENGYSHEEYALIRIMKYFRKAVKRKHYDDGATILGGKIVKIPDAQLRVRYLSNYNFLITAQESPYNSHKFDLYSEEFFNDILTGKKEFSNLFDFLQTFQRFER